jgi:DNA-directed RNA polymerase alpha subunit
MKAACYINIRDGIITIWADPGGMDYFQGFSCKEEDLKETEHTHKSLELEATLRGAKDLPTYENAYVELQKEMLKMRRLSQKRISSLKEEIRELTDERDALHACLRFIRESVGCALDGDICEEFDALNFSRESVNVLGLSVRAANCLYNIGIKNIGQLASKTDNDLLKYRNFGKVSLREVRSKLAAKRATPHLAFD